MKKRCNELEAWLLPRGYSDKLARTHILRARKFKRDDLLDQVRKKDSSRKLVLNLTYPSYSKVKNILQNIHILLAPNQEHRDVYPSPPILDFKRGKNLKDMLVRAKLPAREKTVGRTERCGGKLFGVCEFVEETDSFFDKHSFNSHKIHGDKLNCNSTNLVYLVRCKTCAIQYVGSTSTKFRIRLNNCKCYHQKYSSGKPVIQASFHSHFKQPNHNGMEDWSFTFIDQAENLPSLRRKESFWQHKLNTFQPNGLNERDVTLDF